MSRARAHWARGFFSAPGIMVGTLASPPINLGTHEAMSSTGGKSFVSSASDIPSRTSENGAGNWGTTGGAAVALALAEANAIPTLFLEPLIALSPQIII